MHYLYGPVRNAFDAGSIHYFGKWEGIGPWKIDSFLGPVKRHWADKGVPFGAQKTPVFLKCFTTNEPRKCQIILDFCVVVNIKHVLNADLAVLEELRRGDITHG